MKTAVRRRLALGALATSGALVASLVVAPAALAGTLSITPSAVFTNSTQTLTFTSSTADQRYGATATFTPLVPAATFTATIAGESVPVTMDTTGTSAVDFSDLGNGLGSDGPADVGTYRVTLEGAPSPLPIPGSGGGGTDSCASCFTVLAASPLTVGSISPTSLRPATNADISVLGTGFTRGSKLEFLQNGFVDPALTVGAPTGGTAAENSDKITTATQLRRHLTVGSGAAPGPRDVRVTNPDGSTSTRNAAFSVAGAALTSISPSGGDNTPTATPLTLTVTGPSVVDGVLTLEFLGAPGGASRQSLTIQTTKIGHTATTLSATANLSDAAPGVYQPVVRGPGGVVNACDSTTPTGCRFTIAQNRPVDVTRLERSDSVTGQVQPAGTTRTFDVIGTGFSRGASVTISGTGITTTSVEFVSSTLLRATFQSTTAAATGARDVTLTLTDAKTDTCTGCYTVTAVGTEPATATVDLIRLSGNDRYATAARIAQTPATATATTVVLANGQSDDPRTARNENHFPDALAGAYLAGNRNAPTLLATETTVPQPTLDALNALGTQNVVIVGGTSAISSAVEKQLRDRGLTVTRVAGTTRYDTARAVAKTPPASYVGKNPAGELTAIVANGQNFPDALVSGPLAYRSRFPVVITTPGSLSPQAKATLQDLGIKRVLVAGGTTAVSQATEDQIKALGIASTRLSGPDRTATAAAISAYAYDTLGFNRTDVDLARGDAFPDALAGGPHGGKENAPILLTIDANTLGTPTRDFLKARSAALRTGHIFGGTSAVSTAVERDAEAATTRQAN